jgi:hypothetical protein
MDVTTSAGEARPQSKLSVEESGIGVSSQILPQKYAHRMSKNTDYPDVASSQPSNVAASVTL